ncbi:MAG: N-acetyltransferase, partial [Brevundimonas sp.]|nr:N-acetyltransferase [Brevundimonas sp.]
KVRLQTTTRQGVARLGFHARSARHEGGWGHCHARFAPDAPDPALWSPTPWDGDYAVCLRPLPLTPPGRARATERMRATVSKA